MLHLLWINNNSLHEKHLLVHEQSKERLGGTRAGLCGWEKVESDTLESMHSHPVNSRVAPGWLFSFKTGCCSPSHWWGMFKGKRGVAAAAVNYWGAGGSRVKRNEELQQCARQVETGQKIKRRKRVRESERAEVQSEDVADRSRRYTNN